jgi:hypothetical protein
MEKNKCRGHIPSQFYIFLRLNGYPKEYAKPTWNALPIYMKLRFIEIDNVEEFDVEHLRHQRIDYYGGDDLYGSYDIEQPSRQCKSVLKNNFMVYMKNSGIFYGGIPNIDDYEYFDIDIIASDMALNLWDTLNNKVKQSTNSSKQRQPYP